MNDLSFRKATPSDVPALLKLVQSAYRGDASRAGWTTEADLVADDRIDQDGLLNKINSPNGQVLVAFVPSPTTTTTTTTSSSSSSSTDAEQHQLLACCEIVRHPAAALLGLFSVDPSLQNGGIGRKVLAEAERYAREELGAVAMQMHVLWMRRELIAYYERRGYVLVEGETVPFPYEHMVNPKSGLRQDLHFVVLKKTLE